ncbi:uncharacterized protein SPPG_09046 [Spizellomyces punctatus DAOM BR117]|uniref:PAS domain S-box protein n=1 Tax=Spizellomyces punctatus (strain DAOM BR117) TaxID=645134 RepID=A0A0L0HL49_SPIPD|nr:uncharacterized protein SPPG_09046 [Spizellomyces punctatus DAOM BR117]KND02151.1 hypothetical protein SPPG_09046 [Spizellomyces punctatus DAOM BR117]|eukprot:XP_016610190.1 hypothetical protein SPPG_09046 [Spizellomyces punctatus DAOM BR117]
MESKREGVRPVESMISDISKLFQEYISVLLVPRDGWQIFAKGLIPLSNIPQSSAYGFAVVVLPQAVGNSRLDFRNPQRLQGIQGTMFLLHQQIGRNQREHEEEKKKGYGSDSQHQKLQTMEPKPILGTAPTLVTKIPPSVNLTGIYSATGFDLLGILSRVVHRPNPVIALGPVDLSCAFLVTDPRRPDNPIVYASETFSKLTGYSNAEVLNRNCRFLQAPDGQQEPGQARRYTDNAVVSQLKQAIDRNEECQFTLINYKKGGEPFINLVTVVPVEYGRPGEVSFFVGFQVDLIDQPQAILDRMKDGTYTINYQIAEQLDARQPAAMSDVAAFQQETFHLLSPVQAPKSPDYTPLPDAIENLVEDFDDFVHILSLRGLFLYAAPRSTKRLLEYTAEELMGHSLHEFVHPADFVSVMRELRTSASTDTINIICRFRRKHSGYMYLEINGHIYDEDNNKRTKCFIMSGREKQVTTLRVKNILLPGPDTSETWAKLSLEGLILYVCPNAVPIFGLYPEELVAKSLVEFLHDSDHQACRDALQTIVNGQSVQNLRCRIAVKRGFSSAVLRFYADGCTPRSTIFCQIKAVEVGRTDPLDLKTLVEYEPLYEDGNLFDVMNEVRATSLHYELNQLRLHNKRLREELDSIIAPIKKKTKPRVEALTQCAQCHTSYSPEWRKGPDNQRNLCNACGLRYAKAMRNRASIG